MQKVLQDVILAPPHHVNQLVIKLANVGEELAKPSTGLLAAMWKSQEDRIAAATRIQAAVRGRFAKNRARKEQEAKRNAEQGRRRASVENVRAEAGRRRPSVETVPGPHKTAGISDGFSFAHSCTLWVGKIPIEFFDCPLEVVDKKFKQLFEPYGRILSVSTRKKAHPEDNLKSWGLVTFADQKDVQKVLQSVILAPPDHAHRLVVKLANVDKELAKPSTGLLAVMWKSQEDRITAATRIQAAVRARFAKNHARKAKEAKRNAEQGRRRASVENVAPERSDAEEGRRRPSVGNVRADLGRRRRSVEAVAIAAV